MGNCKEIDVSDFQKSLNEYVQQYGGDAMSHYHKDRIQHDNARAERQAREAQELLRLARQQQQALENFERVQQKNLADEMGKWVDQMQAVEMKTFAPRRNTFPNVGDSFNHSPVSLTDTGDAGRDAHKFALSNMNPIARSKYQEIFTLLDIKLRFTTASMSNLVRQWVIAKMGKDGRMIRQEWTAPSQDPGCSLRTWDAMMGELLDEVARRDGVEIKVDGTTNSEVVGKQAADGARNS